MRGIYLFLFFVTPSHAANNWESLIHEISYDKEKIGPIKCALFVPTKYPQSTNILSLQNFHEKKICAHEKPKRKSFGTTKYLQEKISDT